MIESMQTPVMVMATDKCLTYADNGILGAKNLLSYPYVETTKQIFTDMGDGTIKINGTASERLVFYFHDHVNQWKLPSGTYRASIGTDNNNIAYAIGAYNGTTWVKNLVASTNKDSSFTVDYNGYDRITIFIEVAAGNYSNEIVKPMIRLATDPDNTYRPYAMTNRQLTEKFDKWEDVELDTTNVTDVTHLHFEKNDALKRARVWGYFNVSSISSGYNTIGLLFKNAKPKEYTAVPVFCNGVSLNGMVADTGNIVLQSSGVPQTPRVFLSGEWFIN